MYCNSMIYEYMATKYRIPKKNKYIMNIIYKTKNEMLKKYCNLHTS